MASVFAVAGVAAALAASLAAFVAPIDGALAAPPASKLDVVDLATDPALTRKCRRPGTHRLSKHGGVANCRRRQTAVFLIFLRYPKITGSLSWPWCRAPSRRARCTAIAAAWRWARFDPEGKPSRCSETIGGLHGARQFRIRPAYCCGKTGLCEVICRL